MVARSLAEQMALLCLGFPGLYVALKRFVDEQDTVKSKKAKPRESRAIF